MNRAMPSRAATLIALSLLLVASVLVGVRSYSRFDFVSAFGFVILSESGEVYAYRWTGDGNQYFYGTAGENGRLEIETGSFHRPWLPAWTWGYAGDRFVSVKWWAVALVLFGLLWWRWRRRQCDDRLGFPIVETRNLLPGRTR